MAGVDAIVSSSITNIVIPFIMFISAFLYLKSKRHSLTLNYKNWLLSKDWPHGFKTIREKHKVDLFSILRFCRSHDWDLRNRGLLRILEIGPGEGENFQHYPLNCQLIVVEPNYFTRPLFTRNLKEHPLVNLNQYIEGYAEDLSMLEDDSVDAVVSTGVLCEARNVDLVLEEISRVMASEGIYLFMEHTMSYDSKYTISRKMLNSIWKFVYGCDINTLLPLKLKSKFSKVKYNVIKTKSIILDTIIIGSARNL